MLIVPEIETVVLLVPRTGSGSLKAAVLNRYPEAMPLYRHMEADGVPLGYDRWRRVGVCRNPVDRLWSLFKFIRASKGGSYAKWPDLWRRLQASVNVPFSDWVVANETVFSNGHDSAEGRGYWPHYAVNHSVPENRKSQFFYLRPDLGTHITRFEERHDLAASLDIELPHLNATDSCPPPELTPEAKAHMESFFEWDFAFGGWGRWAA